MSDKEKYDEIICHLDKIKELVSDMKKDELREVVSEVGNLLIELEIFCDGNIGYTCKKMRLINNILCNCTKQNCNLVDKEG